MILVQMIKRIDFRKVLAVMVLGFIVYNASSFEIVSLQIQSERLNKKICIQEMIPSQPPLEVIR
jgi:hypothetical protein